MNSSQINITINQGSTFRQVYRWAVKPIVYKDITGVEDTAPYRLTVPGHGVVEGWRIAIQGIKGPTQLNAKKTTPSSSDYYKVSVVDVDTIELNDVNGVTYPTYISGGVIQYYTPADLAGFLASMSIKDKVGGTLLASYTTGNSKILLDNVDKTVTVTVPATETEMYTWKKGVYDLEMVSGTGVVTRLASGKVTLSQEVTTP